MQVCNYTVYRIRELVDSLYRDATHKQKPYNFTDTLNAYLIAQPFSLSPFMISKTHIVAQKPRRRQLNAEVCGSESAIFVILLSSSDHHVQQ